MAEHGFRDEDFFNFGYVDGGGDKYSVPDETNNFNHEDYTAYATTLVRSTELKKTWSIKKEVWAISLKDASKVLAGHNRKAKALTTKNICTNMTSQDRDVDNDKAADDEDKGGNQWCRW